MRHVENGSKPIWSLTIIRIFLELLVFKNVEVVTVKVPLLYNFATQFK